MECCSFPVYKYYFNGVQFCFNCEKLTYGENITTLEKIGLPICGCCKRLCFYSNGTMFCTVCKKYFCVITKEIRYDPEYYV
jgi:hypothetical protein